MVIKVSLMTPRLRLCDVATMRVSDPDLFALHNPRLRRSPKLHPGLLRLSAMISQYFTPHVRETVISSKKHTRGR
jgi:hypothetical protein